MNFYPFHLGDYATHTRHLSLLEDLAYRRMIDLYYTSESPLPVEPENVARLIGMKDHLDCVKNVLSDFFLISEVGHTHTRCEREISRHKTEKKKQWYYKLTKPQRADIQGRRNAAKAMACPKWLSVDQRKAISDIYDLSAMLTASTGIKHEVDHIIPLRSKIVCGLHVGWNLTVITATQNRAKSNIFKET